MAFLRNLVTTGPGTVVTVRSPFPIRAFLVDGYNNYLYTLRQPFAPVAGGSFHPGADGWSVARLRAPQFNNWWLIVDSENTPYPQATFTVEQDVGV